MVVIIMEEPSVAKQANNNVTSINCSASISSQSRRSSNITNHSNQCNQDVGVPIIVERSSQISSSDVIEQVEGQLLKNNSVRTVVDSSHNNTNIENISERILPSDETYYDVLTSQRSSWFEAATTNVQQNLGAGREHYDSNLAENKSLSNFVDFMPRQAVNVDGKISPSFVVPNEKGLTLPSPEIPYYHTKDSGNSTIPSSCASLGDSKIDNPGNVIGTTNPTSQLLQGYTYLSESESTLTNCSKIKGCELENMNLGVPSSSQDQSFDNQPNDSGYNLSLHNLPISTSKIGNKSVPTTSHATSEPTCIGKIAGSERSNKIFDDEHGAINGGLPQNRKPNHSDHSASPSNNYSFSSEEQENHNHLIMEHQETASYRYPHIQNITEEKCVDNNTMTIKTGKMFVNISKRKFYS